MSSAPSSVTSPMATAVRWSGRRRAAAGATRSRMLPRRVSSGPAARTATCANGRSGVHHASSMSTASPRGSAHLPSASRVRNATGPFPARWISTVPGVRSAARAGQATTVAMTPTMNTDRQPAARDMPPATVRARATSSKGHPARDPPVTSAAGSEGRYQCPVESDSGRLTGMYTRSSSCRTSAEVAIGTCRSSLSRSSICAGSRRGALARPRRRRCSCPRMPLSSAACTLGGT